MPKCRRACTCGTSYSLGAYGFFSRRGAWILSNMRRMSIPTYLNYRFLRSLHLELKVTFAINHPPSRVMRKPTYKRLIMNN